MYVRMQFYFDDHKWAVCGRGVCECDLDDDKLIYTNGWGCRYVTANGERKRWME